MHVNILSVVLSPFDWLLAPMDWLGPYIVRGYWAFQGLSLGLLALTVVFGYLTIIAGREANRQQALEVLGLKKNNIASQRILEAERVARQELEQSLAPRVIPLIQRSAGRWNFDPLKEFGGQEVIIEYLPEYEARRAALQIQMVVTNAGWKLAKPTAPNPELAEFTWDGVTVQGGSFNHAPPKSAEEATELDKQVTISEKAVNGLVKFLLDNKWVAKTFANTKELPPKTVRVLVGFKPAPVALTTELPQERTESRLLALRNHFDDILPVAARWRNPPIPVEISCPASNKEACALADEIVSVLQSTGWYIVGEKAYRDEQFPRRQIGIVLIHDLGTSNQYFASADLSDAFKKAGLESTYHHGLETDASMKILVGW